MGVVTKLQCHKWEQLLRDDPSFTTADLIVLARLPTTRLLSAILLKEVVGQQRAKRYIKQILPIQPEIDLEGNRRCVYEDANKVRCTKYNRDGVVCASHMQEVSMITKHFRSRELRETYDSFLKSGSKMRLDGEQAMMRTMLVQLTKKINDRGDVPMDLIIAITAMCDKISQLTMNMSKMNAITPEHVDNILNGVVEILTQYLPADKLEEAADKVKKLSLQPGTTDIPYEPGTTIEVEGEIKTIEADDGREQQLRALIEEAKRLEIKV